jgi:hypothetical protein
MNEDAHAAAIERIDLALARIERAAQARAFEHHAIGHRHDALKARLHDAIVALDAVIAREEGRD